MDAIPLDEQGNITVRQNPLPSFHCTWEGEDVSPEYAVVMTAADGASTALIQIPAVEPMATAIEAVGDITSNRPLSPSLLVELQEHLPRSRCVGCGTSTEGDSGLLIEPTLHHGRPDGHIVVHEQCINQCADTLRSVWDKTDTMLAESL